MIVDFTVANFRSIKDAQTFSLYAETPGTHLTDNICYPANDKIGVLKTAGIYGANASGKSNLLLALDTLSRIVIYSGDLKANEAIPYYEPYLLSKDTQAAPTVFEIEFVLAQVRYNYKISFTDKKIEEESLIFYPSSQPATIFSRTKDATWETIKFGSLYKGGRKRIPFFPNNSYLSKAGNSADAPQIIQAVYAYFSRILYVSLNSKVLQMNMVDEEFLLPHVSKFLSFIDTGISEIKVEKTLNIDFKELTHANKQEFFEKRQKNYKYMFSHKTDSDALIFFEEGKESDGTRKLFRLAPIVFFIIWTGGILVIDELDSSMHPFMAELIIKLFNDPRVNKRNAQLIFSTHNINLMSPDHLRRDQLWFTEKNDGETTLYSLDDFDKKRVKPQSPFNLWYAEGRFGAVPRINYEEIVQLFENRGKKHAQEEN